MHAFSTTILLRLYLCANLSPEALLSTWINLNHSIRLVPDRCEAITLSTTEVSSVGPLRRKFNVTKPITVSVIICATQFFSLWKPTSDHRLPMDSIHKWTARLSLLLAGTNCWTSSRCCMIWDDITPIWLHRNISAGHNVVHNVVSAR